MKRYRIVAEAVSQEEGRYTASTLCNMLRALYELEYRDVHIEAEGTIADSMPREMIDEAFDVATRAEMHRSTAEVLAYLRPISITIESEETGEQSEVKFVFIAAVDTPGVTALTMARDYSVQELHPLAAYKLAHLRLEVMRAAQPRIKESSSHSAALFAYRLGVIIESSAERRAQEAREDPDVPT